MATSTIVYKYYNSAVDGHEDVLAIRMPSDTCGFLMACVKAAELDGLVVDHVNSNWCKIYYDGKFGSFAYSLPGCTLVRPFNTFPDGDVWAYFVPEGWLVSGSEQDRAFIYSINKLHRRLAFLKDKIAAVDCSHSYAAEINALFNKLENRDIDDLEDRIAAIYGAVFKACIKLGLVTPEAILSVFEEK
jgi:hypothetical protein